MSKIEQKEVINDEFVQQAELRIPIDMIEIPSAPSRDANDYIKDSFALVETVKKIAMDHLKVDEDNADYTVVELKAIEADVLVIEIAQVSVE